MTSAISIENISMHFGDAAQPVKALDNVSVEIRANEFFTLLGPSGCGKTTLLRLIAGFEQPSSGTIRLYGEPMQDLPPFRRPVNTVFQSYALFPHMTVAENIADAQNYDARVIKTVAEPFKDKAGIAVLRGNLAPRGAVIKPSAATPALMVHTGRAVVFEDSTDFHKRIDDESLDVDENCILVLKNCGPKGYPGMAEVGNMPLPPKVLRKGITDMVRISDARMSGTAYGTVVLHTTPEAAAGGPLAIVQNGDMIELNVPQRKLQLLISDEELAARMAKWTAPPPALSSGYWKLYIDHVLQADEGADLDFLVGQRGAFVPKDNH